MVSRSLYLILFLLNENNVQISCVFEKKKLIHWYVQMCSNNIKICFCLLGWSTTWCNSVDLWLLVWNFLPWYKDIYTYVSNKHVHTTTHARVQMMCFLWHVRI
jgi:hypothetical protein